MPQRRALALILVLLILPLAAPLRAATLELLGADWSGGGLRLRLAIDLSGEPLQALEQGVGLPFVLQWRRCLPDCGAPLGRQRLELRHAPLLQRYLLQLDQQPPRQFPFRAALLAAFEQPPPLPLERGEGWQLRLQLWHEELPAPLRLPALLEPGWQLDTGWQAVP